MILPPGDRRFRGTLARVGRAVASREASGRMKGHKTRNAVVLALGAVGLSACQLPNFGGYRGSTAQGYDTHELYAGAVIAAIVVGVLVFALITWSVFRYRARPAKGGDASIRMPRQFHDNPVLEIVYTVVPVIIVGVLFFFTVLTENNVDAVSTHPYASIKVTAFQWGWQFNYQGEGVQIIGNDVTQQYPQMVVPTGKTVRITLVSNDVVHGFYVPAFNFSRYAQPGIVNLFDLTVTHSGVYRGQCTQFCGLYHSEMVFTVKAVPAAQYQSWLRAEQANQADHPSQAPPPLQPSSKYHIQYGY